MAETDGAGSAALSSGLVPVTTSPSPNEEGKKVEKNGVAEDKDKKQVLKENEDEEVKGGELLFCGCASWEIVGRKTGDGCVNLVAPTRLSTLMTVDIAFIASGSASTHCVALDVNGRCYTWGRNERGQLGHGDLLQRNTPTLVTALTRHVFVKAGAGRSHTVVVTEDGSSMAFGWNKHGQLGSGTLKEVEMLPVRSLITDAKQAVCGAEFTIWLTSLPGSSIMSAGCPQYGQLGHGTDNEYNSKESSVKLVYEPQPRPRAIGSLSGKNIVKAACGNNHTVAADSDGYVYTWGFGGHGRLGHKEQKDEWVPRVVEVFQRTNTLPASAVIAAGSSYSACTAGGGQLYMWGRVKSTGDNWMYPKPVLDLSGWNIRSMDCGNTSSFAAADSSCISWGTSVYGELGYGPSGPKSSASPKLVDLLEGMNVLSVACGVGHSLLLVDRSKLPEKLEKLEVYSGHGSSTQVIDPPEDRPVKTPAKGRLPGAEKRKATTPVPSRVGSKKSKSKPANKDVSESEDESNGEYEPENRDGNKPAGGRGRGRGSRGRGRGRESSDSRGASKTTPSKQTKVEEPTRKGRERPVRGQTKVSEAAEVEEPKSPAVKRGRGRPRRAPNEV